MKRPNILFAIADDASHFGAYGNGFVRTPAFDRLAEQGAIFKNTFTPNPKCAPSRACILTGRYPWQLRDACNHNCYFPPNLTLFPDLLEHAGYHIGYTGKGWAPGDYARAGYMRNPAGPEYNRRTLVPPNGSHISNCDYAENLRDFLDAKPVDTPFYFWYGGREPHRKYTFGEALRYGKKLSDITELPSYWPNDDRVKTDLLDYAFEIEWFDKQLGRMMDLLEERGELENTLIVATSDNGCPFPRVKGQMYEQDLHLPMAAYWHGHISPGLIIDDLISFVDIAPTIADVAGLDPPEGFAGNSFLELLHSRPDRYSRKYAYFGREKQDVGRENDLGYPVRCIRDQEYLYIRNFKPDRWPVGNPETGFTNCDSSPTKMLILEQHANGNDIYFNPCFGKRPEEELYHVASDQECMNNLAENPQYQHIKFRLWESLHSFLQQTDDPRILGNEDVFERYPHSKVGKHSWESYVNGGFVPQSY